MKSAQPQPPGPFSQSTPAVACSLFVIPQRSGGICFCPCSSEGAWGFSPTNALWKQRALALGLSRDPARRHSGEARISVLAFALVCHSGAARISASVVARHSEPKAQNLCRCLFVCHPERSLARTVTNAVEGPAVVCSCCHPERVFRARRTPTKPASPQPPVPFSQSTPAVACSLFVIPQRSGGICFSPTAPQSTWGTNRKGTASEPALSEAEGTCGCLFLLSS
jgi:hypothetical protein